MSVGAFCLYQGLYYVFHLAIGHFFIIKYSMDGVVLIFLSGVWHFAVAQKLPTLHIKIDLELSLFC